jgi:nitrogen fixation-related uncharacterized protein
MKRQLTSRSRPWLTIVLTLIILLPALVGFGTKFREFLLLVGDADGAFTILPILNYLLVSLGFVGLFLWAVLQGMFRDIEKPKYRMLLNEQRLDAEMRRDQEPNDEEADAYGRA